MKKIDTERWAVVEASGRIVVIFERPSTTGPWARWVASGKRSRRAVRVRIVEVAEKKKRAATKGRDAKRAVATVGAKRKKA